MNNLIKNKTHKRILLGAVIIIGLIVATSLFSVARGGNFLPANILNGASSNTESVSDEGAVVVQTQKISLENIMQSISASAVTEPLNRAKVSSKITGKVVNIYFKEGDWVGGGQTIIQLEQGQTLRVAYNNAQINLINTRASMDQDIKAAEVAVEAAKSTLENIKVNTQENIKNAELAVKAAEVALESAKKSLDNTENTNQQTIQDCYDSIQTTMQSNLSAINTALTAVGDIIGEKPGNASANDDYEDVLGVQNIQSLRDTRNLFLQAKNRYETANNSYDNLNTDYSSFNEIDSAVDTVGNALDLTKQTLIQTRILLDNTITCSGFPASSLANLKTSIDTNLNGPYGINAAINALQANKQAITNAKLGKTTGNDAAQSAHDATKTALEQAKQNLISAKAQAQSQVEAAQKQFESAEANLASVKKRAELQIAAAQGQLDSVQAQLGNTAITAPISGVVSRKYIEVGEMAMAGNPVAEIVNTNGIEIELSLTEFDVGKIFIGQEAKVSLAAYPDEEFIGRIYCVSSVADSVSKKFPVKIQLANTDGKVKVGMVADVEIITDQRKGVLVIPKSAVFKKEDVEKVYVLENSRVKIKTIKTEVVDENRIKVVEGLSAGEEIIDNGSYNLQNGELVTVKNQ